MNATTTTTAGDRQAIEQVIQLYIDGGTSGRAADMKPAFHEGATIFGYLGPDFIGGPIQGLFDWVDQNPPASGLRGSIAALDVAGTVALVRLELDDWGGHRFTDIFTLLKVDGEWKIISKVFHLHP